MADSFLDIQRVAVIGAGVSGVAGAIHLKRAGLEVKVYERTARAGGIWVYDERIPKDAEYPSVLPSVGDSPEYGQLLLNRHGSRADSPMQIDQGEERSKPNGDGLSLSFAPPGPCYVALKNNVSTIEMEMTCQAWKPGTEEFVPHKVLADYIQDSAEANGVLDSILFNTRVDKVEKVGSNWEVATSNLVSGDLGSSIRTGIEYFDAVVAASGHYHACNIPDISGLPEWKRRHPASVSHSKRYRSFETFPGQNVLLIGAGVSSMDIARDLGSVARAVYQSSRGGPYDLPSHLLPDNGARIGAIRSFDAPSSSELAADGSIQATVTLSSGERLCGIHRVIVCTGYHVSFPFMRQYHANGVRAENADDNVLVTDGQQTHNLHKEIWYIEDPTLAFIGVPYHVATFSLFEAQAIALAAVFSGKVGLPLQSAMRSEYNERLWRKGSGRNFHSLKKQGDEIGYVQELVEVVRKNRQPGATVVMSGHPDRWLEAYGRRRVRQQALFSKIRDPLFDRRVIEMIEGC